MSFPAAECEAGAACATRTNNACRKRPAVKGEERQRPLTAGRGRRNGEPRERPQLRSPPLSHRRRVDFGSSCYGLPRAELALCVPFPISGGSCVDCRRRLTMPYAGADSVGSGKLTMASTQQRVANAHI